ncbi:MAG: phosphohistidine phosphatase SixA [Cyanobacteria bacterium RI_101]|nr:phosphohistidine phosphatase SixA [Cyanobacteria bacterium RI_101]
MELYLIRHGIATERQDEEDDAQRALTPKGWEKTQKVARRLVELGLSLEVIFASPLVRAQQTGQILLEAGLGRRLETLPALAPGGDLTEALAALAAEATLEKAALVGHQPDLGEWAETLVWGENRDKLILKKAGVIGLAFNRGAAAPGAGELFLLAPPRFLLD